MNERIAIHGVWCATLTPLDGRGAVDHGRLAAHVWQLFDAGIDGVAPFGTTGEGQSFSTGERKQALEALIGAGIAPARILAATGCAAGPETADLTRHAIECGCVGALVLPPFFWKDVSADGVYASYAALIDDVADARLRLYLYHIPQITAVPIAGNVTRFVAAYPGHRRRTAAAISITARRCRLTFGSRDIGRSRATSPTDAEGRRRRHNLRRREHVLS
jgi:4-hydroxy-tetrahydrodipicolinate synthase